jgi:uncharacterized protein (DUF1499 family)
MKRKRMVSLYVLIAVVVVMMGYVRFAPSDQSIWHQDPETITSTGKPNEHRLIGDAAPVYDLPAQKLLELVHSAFQNEPRITVIAGHPNELMLTYVERSLIMGYPDYITVKATSINPNQSKLMMYSRSRFGYSDLGVNKRRIGEWVAIVQGLIAG